MEYAIRVKGRTIMKIDANNQDHARHLFFQQAGVVPIKIKPKGKKGWKSESVRHSLASKGIKTGRKKIEIKHSGKYPTVQWQKKMPVKKLDVIVYSAYGEPYGEMKDTLDSMGVKYETLGSVKKGEEPTIHYKAKLTKQQYNKLWDVGENVGGYVEIIKKR